MPDGSFRGDRLKAHGEINTSQFNTFAFFLQHDQKFEKTNSKITAGINVDFSPSHFYSNYIGIDRDESGFYTGYVKTDSALSHYATDITNLASYLNYNQDIIKGLRLVAALRYDYYQYNYQNNLSSKSFSGAPSTKNQFQTVTPKLGLTYNYGSTGFYANYSQGFVPPQISELYQGVRVPYLSPQTFFNSEIGGWLELYKGKIFADWSVYSMKGTNEILSVLSDDGAFRNENAGETLHQGVEYGISYKPSAQWKLRAGAANAKHIFVQYGEKGINYNGNIMAGAPSFLMNAEVSYKPRFIKGLRTSFEWQHQSSYWLDNSNTRTYNGFDIVNVRAGYQFKFFEVWLNILNAADKYYSVAASKSGSGYSYNLGQPRTFNTGIAYQLSRR
jgi:outer membrane receptor protein involved in Fe transport